MKSPALAAATALAISLVASPSHAQLAVYDLKNYVQLVDQLSTAKDQLTELKSQITQAQRLYDGFNQVSNVNSLATSLATPTLRAFLPDIDTYMAAAKGDLTALGQIGQKARGIRQANRLYTPPAGDALGQDLEQAGDRAARDMALGQQAATVGADRLTGLQELTMALDTAPNARAVMDIQARLTAEQAMIANDQMRLQGLAMAQDAEQRLQAQRERERAAAARAARLELYRQGFQ